MKGDVGKAFNILLNSMYIKYEGCLIDKRVDGYWWAGCRFDTEQQAKDCIDSHLALFGNSINRIRQ
jgi:hypothetical protein